MSTPEWIPMFAMPNVLPQNPIEIDGIAFVADFDDRIKALRKKYPKYDDYLNRFTNEFGRKLSTGTIIGARRSASRTSVSTQACSWPGNVKSHHSQHKLSVGILGIGECVAETGLTQLLWPFFLIRVCFRRLKN